MMKHQLWRKAAAMLPTLLLSFCTMAQTHSVSGTITDEEQLPIPGANVVIKGTTTGTITAGDGKFTMEAKDGDVLQISYIGYTTEEVIVNGNGPYNLSLVPDMVGLSEVVVVGYGTQRKEAVTGSVASMKGDVIRELPGSNITQSLQGRIAGVDMQQTSTKPGATMQIRIRGTRSLNASNDPLVVLDGIPFAGSLSDIDPASIKSIDILKDASATAIYGSRGANGVILVTSTKGSIEQDATIVYSGYYGIKDVFAKYPMMNAKQFAEMRAFADRYTNSDLEQEGEDKGVDTDWQDLMYDKGMVTSHDLSVTGGTKSAAYSFGFGYYREEAVLPLQNFSRLSFRSAVDQKVGKYIKVGFTSSNNYSINNGNSIGIYGVLSASPLIDPYDENGNLRRTFKMNTTDESWTYVRESLEKADADGDFEDKNLAYGTYNSFYTEFSVPRITGLKYRMNAGLNLKYTQNGQYRGVGFNAINETTASSASLSKSLNLNWAVENLITYDRTIDKHTINAVGLLSFERSQNQSSSASASGIASKKFLYYNLGRLNDEGSVSVSPNGQSYSEYGLKSAMARLMYSYDDRYMLTVAVRNDKSSRLAPSKNSHTYPAVSVGWNVGREAFMDSFDWMNSLKLRVGYGQTSNQAVAPFKTLGALGSRPYNFGNDTYSTGYYVSELANPELGWEYSETMNYGIDFGFFNRISGSFEYYVQNTNDVLLSVNLPSTSGVSRYMANIGKTQNKGWEFNVNATILDNYNGLTWEAGVNMYHNRNELVELASGAERDEGNFWFVGHPINSIFDYEYEGIWQEDDFNYKPDGAEKSYGEILEPTCEPGDIRVKYTGEFDENGMPTRKIDASDRTIQEMDPKLQGGFNTRLEYKGFDLTVIGAFQAGGKLISTLHASYGYLNMLSGRRNNVDVDYWTPENTGAKYPKPGGALQGDNPKYGSTLGYFNASYCKLRTITLGYNFKNNGISVLDEIGIKKIRVYATIQNPWVIASKFHKETGLDPETNSFGNENVAVTPGTYKANTVLTVGTNTPATRTYLVGLNITF
jgi:TonB-linked SusC/RagA family outer membrane protein